MALDDSISHVILTEEDIKARVNDLGEEIGRDYAGSRYCLSVFCAARQFLWPTLPVQYRVQLSWTSWLFRATARQRNSSGVVRILKDLDEDIKGRDVLVCEDILDTGLTLKYLLRNLKSRRPAKP